MAAFGFTSSSWGDAVRRGVVRPRASAMPIEKLLAEGTYRGRYNLKLRLIGAGLKQEVCERCGLEAWYGAPISLALHHINGKRNDNRLENLQLLCPNCHSQTDTFGGRNGRRRAPR
ncbi:MAG: HNH endonuclease [Solirubrobacteraceae bacterium]